MRIQFALLSATLLAIQSTIVSAQTSASSSTLACKSVALSSQASSKWVVSCITEETVPASSASFDPSLVQDYIVNSDPYVTASAFNINLSSTFSKVDALESSSITRFSLSAALEFKPTIPLSIVPTAFAELSSLQILHLEAIPLADSNLHLLLPSSIQQISIIDCGLSNFSITFTDGSLLGDSALSFIDLRLNNLNEVPASLYAMPSSVSTIDLRGNDQLNFSAETTAHAKQLQTWKSDEVLKAESAVFANLALSSQEKRKSIVGSARMKSPSVLPNSSSKSNESITATRIGINKSTVLATIVAVVVSTMLILVFVLSYVKRKRRNMQDRESDAVLCLPHPFSKMSRDRSESLGNSTTADSELSRKRLSSGDSHYYDAHDRDSCVMLDIPLADANAEPTQPSKSMLTSASYVNVICPIKISPANSKKETSSCVNGSNNHSLELLGAKSTVITTPAQTRLANRKRLRLTLKTLLEAKPSANDISSHTLLTVNTCEYSFSRGTKVKETPLAFFIDCQLDSCGGKPNSVSVPPSKLTLKIFVDNDAHMAERESYALLCLQQGDSTRGFAPRIHDTALEYELVGQYSKLKPNVAKINCCILVLEMPSCIRLSAEMAASGEPSPEQISCLLTAVRALHIRGLVHGALHTDSLVACSPYGRLKLWGLEHASRAGHTSPCPNATVLGVREAEYVAPEFASFALKETSSCRAAPSLDVWSLGVIILKMYVSGQQLEEFEGCSTPRDVFRRLNASDFDGKASRPCFFRRSIARYVQNDDLKDTLHKCLQRNWTSRPSVDSILKHNFFQPNRRRVPRPLSMKASCSSPASMKDEDLVTSYWSNDIRSLGEPEREASGRDHSSDTIPDKVPELLDVAPEPLPPSLCLFLPPVELKLDLTQRTSYSVEQWVSELKHLQQQQADELRFPLVFMCESYELNTAVSCSVATMTKFGVSVSASLLPLVMPLVRETMLFLEARAIVCNGSKAGKACGLASPHPWHQLRTFYRALEHMELATVNPVNEVELAPMEQQLNARDPKKAQKVLEKLARLLFSKDKREYIRNLLDAFVSDEDLASRTECGSWAALRRFDMAYETSSTLSRTRWLCSHHAPHHI
ncbi:unnamed protein product [Peronospora effusa]|nr:unnamed protein product [Peronospora effusa]